MKKRQQLSDEHSQLERHYVETAARRENNAVNRDKYVSKKEKIKEKTDYIDKHVSSLDIFNHRIVCFRDWNSLACVFLGILLKSGFHQLF